MHWKISLGAHQRVDTYHLQLGIALHQLISKKAVTCAKVQHGGVWLSELADKFEEAIHARIAMKHRGVPDDLVGLVVYLASDASHYVTGQVIAHDGGWDAVVA